MAEKTQKLKIVFHTAEGYRILSASGVWGGVTPQGDVLAEFFVERREHPDSLTLEVKEGKGHETDRSGGDTIIREMQIGITMRPDIAFSIGNWLIEKARSVGVGVPPKEVH